MSSMKLCEDAYEDADVISLIALKGHDALDRASWSIKTFENRLL